MASEKVINILKSEGAPFSEDEMELMPDKKAWEWIYAQRPPKKPKLPEICFTGFTPEEKQELWVAAEDAGFRVIKSVTKNLKYLCKGEFPGPTKIEKAEEQGCEIINEDDFWDIIKREKEIKS